MKTQKQNKQIALIKSHLFNNLDVLKNLELKKKQTPIQNKTHKEVKTR